MLLNLKIKSFKPALPIKHFSETMNQSENVRAILPPPKNPT
jgi:hypothetical protein